MSLLYRSLWALAALALFPSSCVRRAPAPLESLSTTNIQARRNHVSPEE